MLLSTALLSLNTPVNVDFKLGKGIKNHHSVNFALRFSFAGAGVT